MTDFPKWIIKLAKRLFYLDPGRYQIILTIDDNPNWTVTNLGKVEKG